MPVNVELDACRKVTTENMDYSDSNVQHLESVTRKLPFVSGQCRTDAVITTKYLVCVVFWLLIHS
jgi:hypothetical protein